MASIITEFNRDRSEARKKSPYNKLILIEESSEIGTNIINHPGKFLEVDLDFYRKFPDSLNKAVLGSIKDTTHIIQAVYIDENQSQQIMFWGFKAIIDEEFLHSEFQRAGIFGTITHHQPSAMM